MTDLFKTLSAINVNDKTDKKSRMTYLSWAWAVEEFSKHTDFTYEVKMFAGECGERPYIYDPATGYMVFTTVTVGEVTKEMWLPVMDGANQAMKAEPYTYSTKSGNKTVGGATMFDVNKTIMRCLVKNLAMFGLGLYIYAGEDLPELDLTEEQYDESFFTKAISVAKNVKELETLHRSWKQFAGKDGEAFNRLVTASGARKATLTTTKFASNPW